jgi:hypothetical protein
MKEQHKLVHTISLYRELNLRPLAYGNTASIKGTTMLIKAKSPSTKIEGSMTRVVLAPLNTLR